MPGPAPGEAAPGRAGPGELASGVPAADGAAPGEAAPGEAAPGEAAPGEAAPGEAAPGEAAPELPSGGTVGWAPGAFESRRWVLVPDPEGSTPLTSGGREPATRGRGMR